VCGSVWWGLYSYSSTLYNVGRVEGAVVRGAPFRGLVVACGEGGQSGDCTRATCGTVPYHACADTGSAGLGMEELQYVKVGYRPVWMSGSMEAIALCPRRGVQVQYR